MGKNFVEVKKFLLDVFFGMLFIVSLVFFIRGVSAFRVFDIIDPIGEAFADMDFTDIYFSQLLQDYEADENIVLVNIGVESRYNIAVMLETINKYNPKVVGVDSFFFFPKEDTLGDMMLAGALANVKNLVLASKIEFNPRKKVFDSLAVSWPTFTKNSVPAFANFITDAGDQEDLKMCREFNPQLTLENGKVINSFAVELSNYYDPKRVDKFLERKNIIETINFRGNVLDFGMTGFGTKFFALDVVDVLEENFSPDLIKDKIVIFCYLGNYLGDRVSIEDKYFTPLNKVYIGRTLPDMFGGVVHANIISMILNGKYIDKTTENQELLIGLLALFFNVLLFVWIYRSVPMWYDGLSKLIQFIEIMIFVYVMVYIMDYYAVKLELTITLFLVAISGDAIEMYFGIVRNIFSKRGRKQLLKIHKKNHL